VTTLGSSIKVFVYENKVNIYYFTYICFSLKFAGLLFMFKLGSRQSY